MIETLKCADSAENKKWDNYIKSRNIPGHALSGWQMILEIVYDCHVIRLMSKKGEEITGICMAYHHKGGDTLYTSRFGFHGSNDAMVEILSWLDEYCKSRNLKKILVTSGNTEFPNLPDRNVRIKGNMLLPLAYESEEDMWLSLPKKTKNMVRKAEKSDLVFKQSWESLDGFYAVYKDRFISKMLAIKPREYFEKLPEMFNGDVHLLSVTQNGKVVGGMIFLKTGKAVTYLYNASEDEAMRNGGNNLLMWKAMKYFYSQGAEFIELGESTKDGAVYNFKKRLSKNIKGIDIFYMDKDYREYNDFSFLNKIKTAKNIIFYKVFPFLPKQIKEYYMSQQDKTGRLI